MKNEESVDKLDLLNVQEIGLGIHQQEVLVSKKKEGVLAEMPDFGYMLWSREGKELSDQEVQKKIMAGAKVVCTLSGLDSDPRQFAEIAKQMHHDYVGGEELLVLGLACPGFWRQQYDNEHKLKISDVATAKYVQMTLEFAKKMGMNERNTLILGHSAGGEAATYLSKWFKILALSASLHLNPDNVFAGVSGADLLSKFGEFVIGRENVNRIQDKTIQLLTGAAVGSPQMKMHMDRSGDGNGWSFDVKVWELCLKDELPDWNIDPTRISLVGGGRDILTSYQKKRAWFRKWMTQSGFDNNQAEKMWNEMTEWFPENVSHILKHDSSLLDVEARKLIVHRSLLLLAGLENEGATSGIGEEAIGEMAQMTEKNIQFDDPELMKAKLDETLGRKLVFSNLKMSDYVYPELYSKLVGFVNEYLSQGDEWVVGELGKRQWLDVVSEMLSYSGQFEEAELQAIRSGELSLLDPRIYQRVIAFPAENEAKGWMVLPEMQNDDVRGSFSRGQLLDPSLYVLTDVLIRKMGGMGEDGELWYEKNAYPKVERTQSNRFRLSKWVEQSWNS